MPWSTLKKNPKVEQLVQTLLSALSHGTQLKVAFDQTVGFGLVGQVVGATHEEFPVELPELEELVEWVPLFQRKNSQADPARPQLALLTVVQSMARAAGRRRESARISVWILIILYCCVK